MPAYYRCKWCKGTHRVPREYPNRQTFEKVPLHRHVFSCPVESRGAVYRRQDLFWTADPLDVTGRGGLTARS